MQLFSIQRKKLELIERNPFKLERDIQILIEQNIETLFELELVASEFTVGKFRLDTLAYDGENNCFVIIEYKKNSALSVVDQGFSYLSAMLSNKAEFIVEYNEKNSGELKNPLKRGDISWENSRVIFISPFFTEHQKSIKFKDLPFELWEIKRFNKNLILLDQIQIHSPSAESIKRLAGKSSSSEIIQVSEKVKIYSEDEHIKNLNEEMLPVWSGIKERLEPYAETSFAVTKSHISWKRNNSVVCYIHLNKKELKINISRGNQNTKGKFSRKFFSIDDPKKMSQEKSWTWKSGSVGHNYSIGFRNLENLDYLLFLLEQKYKSLE